MSDTRAPVADEYLPLYAFVSAIAARFGLTNVIWAHQTAAAPPLPYAVISVNHEKQVGMADLGVTQNGVSAVRINVTLELCVDVFGKEAFGLASRIRLASNTPSALLALHGWSVALRHPVVDVSALIEKTVTQQRARVVFLMQGGLQVADDMGYIETVTTDCCGAVVEAP